METDSDPNSLTKAVINKSHYTHINCKKEIQLSRCHDDNCKCMKVHCPFCDVQHFKPSGSMRVRDHITQSHFKYAVVMGETLIVKCFHKCNMTSGHFHCPYCEQQLYKRRAFSQHLRSHLKKIGKDENTVTFFYSNQPKTISFGGVEIELCSDSCEDMLGQHYHCPLCGRRKCSSMGVMVTHLWRCQDRIKYRCRLPVLQESQTGLQEIKHLPHLKEVLGEKWHISIVRTLSDLPVVQCDLDICCNKKFHCGLCTTEVFKPANYLELKQHFVTHWDNRVSCLDYSMLPCYLNCEVREKVSEGVQCHYHCPGCGQTFIYQNTFATHLKECTKGNNSIESVSEIDQKPFDSTDGNTKSLEMNNKKSVDNFTINTTDAAEKSQIPRFQNAPVLREPKTELFETVTAILSNDTITKLEERLGESISNILGSVTHLAGCHWSSSPGTQKTVHALNGTIENIAQAKQILEQKLKSQESDREQESENSSNQKSTISTQTDISLMDSLAMVTPDSNTTSIDNRTAPVQSDDQLRHYEQQNVSSKDFKKIPSLKKRKPASEIMNKKEKILKRKVGRPRKFSLFPSEDISLQDKSDIGVKKIRKADVRLVQRRSRSPHSKRKLKSLPSITKEQNKNSEADLTNVTEAKVYGTRGKKMDFSFLATGKKKKKPESRNYRCEKEPLTKVEVAGREIKMKTLTVNLTDINKQREEPVEKTSKEFSESEEEEEEEEEEEMWQDDSDEDPDFVVEMKNKMSDSEDDGHSAEVDDNLPSKLSKSARKKVHDEKRISKNLSGACQKFCVPQITVPLDSLHQSIQRCRKKDGGLTFEGPDELDECVSGLEDELSLKCMCCDFPGKSSVDLKEHMIKIHKFDPLHTCFVCGKTFETHQSRSLHIKTSSCGQAKTSQNHHCLKCSFTSPNFADVTDHLIQEHSIANPLRCDVCEKRLKDKHKHLKHRHGPKNRNLSSDSEDWGCQYCQFTSDVFSEVTDHLIQTHDVSDPLRCDVCEVTFKQSKAYHVKQKHGPTDKYTYNKATSCLLCRRSFDQFCDLTQHIINEHHMDNLRCDVCEMVFSSTQALEIHLDKIHGPSDIQCCNVCGRGFKTERALIKHKQLIHQICTEVRKQCKKCDFEAHSKNELKRHMATHADKNECPVCHKVLAKNTNIMIHIDTMHTSPQQCVCNICGKTFRHPRYLRLHLGRHSGIKPHVCSICGKRFFATNTLHSHMEIHKDQSDRTYRHICSVCGRGFNGKTNLDDHMNKHTGAKPHSCPLCGIKFGFRSMLYKHHQFVHSDLRPFSCSICSKSYKSKQRLSAHMVCHTGISKFNCQQCKKAFSTSSTLKHHLPRCRGERTKQFSASGDIIHANNEIIIQLISNDESTVKIEQLEQNEVVHIVEEVDTATGTVEEVVQGEQISQVYLCSVCAMTFPTYQAAESHIGSVHAEQDSEHQTYQQLQVPVTPKQEVFDCW